MENDAFCDLVSDSFLHQFIMGPTHIAGNKLDLLLCNYPETIGNVSTLKPQSCNFPTDHYVIEFQVKLKFTRAKPVRRRVYDYKRGNFGDLRNFLTRVPFDITTSDNIDQYWLQWKDMFLTAVESYIPVKTMSDTNSPPWIDGEVRHLIRKKYTALKKYRLVKSDARKLKLRTLSQKIKYAIRRKHSEYLAKIEASFKDNPKLFCYHKSILHHRENQGPKITYNGVTANYTAAAKAKLNFKLVFPPGISASKSNVSPDIDDNSPPLSTIIQFSDITLGVDEVKAFDTSRLLKDRLAQVAR